MVNFSQAPVRSSPRSRFQPIVKGSQYFLSYWLEVLCLLAQTRQLRHSCMSGLVHLHIAKAVRMESEVQG